MAKTATPFMHRGRPIQVDEAERLDLERQGANVPKAAKASERKDDTKKESEGAK